jgi:predicted transcriptional regulator of viral defense system
MPEKDQEIKEIFREHQGLLRLSKAQKLGIPKHKIYKMRDSGVLIRENRGYYRLSNVKLDWNPDLFILQERIPKGILSLISALNIHRLTLQIPDRIYLTLLRGAKKPRIEFPPVDFVWQAEPAYSSGIIQKEVDGIDILVYDREKTIADCFKFRKKIGFYIAVEALKEYMKQPGVNLQKLQEYAQTNRVKKLITPYIEALI